jgi:hypothetical protein
MTDLAILALRISIFSLIASILSIIVQIASTFNNWKKPEIKVNFGNPEGELKKVKGKDVVDLQINVDITNSGNEDTFIKSIWIHHLEKTGLKTGTLVGCNIKLIAHNTERFDAHFSPDYNPEEEPPYQGYDKIVVIVIDNKDRKFIDEVYYSINKENNQINNWMFFDWKKSLKELNKEERIRLNKDTSSKGKGK